MREIKYEWAKSFSFYRLMVVRYHHISYESYFRVVCEIFIACVNDMFMINHFLPYSFHLSSNMDCIFSKDLEKNDKTIFLCHSHTFKKLWWIWFNCTNFVFVFLILIQNIIILEHSYLLNTWRKTLTIRADRMSIINALLPHA